MHRHFGFDIYLITQSPKKLASHILADVGCQLHLRRVFKMKRSTIYEFPEAHATVYKSIRDDAINKTIWKFPKHLYGTYTSTEVDTHKGNIPTKYIIILLIIFIGIPGYLARAFWLDPLFGHKKEETHVINPTNNQVIKNIDHSNLKTTEQPKEDLQAIENSRISMVIESSTDCVVKNSYGEVLDITIDQCRLLSRKNTRIPLSRLKRESSSGLPHSHYDSNPEEPIQDFDPTQPGKKG